MTGDIAAQDGSEPGEDAAHHDAGTEALVMPEGALAMARTDGRQRVVEVAGEPLTWLRPGTELKDVPPLAGLASSLGRLTREKAGLTVPPVLVVEDVGEKAGGEEAGGAGSATEGRPVELRVTRLGADRALAITVLPAWQDPEEQRERALAVRRSRVLRERIDIDSERDVMGDGPLELAAEPVAFVVASEPGRGGRGSGAPGRIVYANRSARRVLPQVPSGREKGRLREPDFSVWFRTWVESDKADRGAFEIPGSALTDDPEDVDAWHRVSLERLTEPKTRSDERLWLVSIRSARLRSSRG